jgi:hypothetical protein
LTGIEPDSIFAKSNMSYWRYYLKLFDKLRNPSAHCLGDIHFDLERKHTIEAQCFAALVLRGYITCNEIHFDDAIDALAFNRNLLNRVMPNISTPLTKGDEFNRIINPSLT